MSLKIICSGQLIRHPLGGHCWHHLQYLIGFKRMGHSVTFFEDYGWEYSCYDVGRNDVGDDPSYGIAFVKPLFEQYGLAKNWCYLAADGTAHGLSREELADRCRECDVYFDLSAINRIPETDACRRRVLVDTDPVFTQIGRFGMHGGFERYTTLCTYGENVHQPGCRMPTAGQSWLPTRQPVVLDLWPQTDAPDTAAPWTTVMNWSAYGGDDPAHEGKTYGQKAREFQPLFDLPRVCEQPMEVAVLPPADVAARLREGGWRINDPLEITRSPAAYQRYLQQSRGEFSVAKHGYVATQCGWFSDRTSAYLASGRPAVVQDTGFSRSLPVGDGLHGWSTPAEAIRAIRRVNQDYPSQCKAARAVAEQHFGADLVLTRLLEQVL